MGSTHVSAAMGLNSPATQQQHRQPRHWQAAKQCCCKWPLGANGRPTGCRLTPHIIPAAAASAGFPADEGSSQQLRKAQGASMPATCFNLTNVIMGAGYVSIPFALRQGGWAALPLLWVLGGCFCYTGLALLQCCRLVDQQTSAAASKATSCTLQQQQQQQQQQEQLQEQGGKPVAGYEAVAGAAFGRLGLAVVSSVMYAELLGICCVYVVLEADALCTLLSPTQLGAALQQQLGPNTWGLLASLLLVPTVLLPDLAALSVLGALGVTAAATVGLVLATMFFLGAAPAAAAAAGPSGLASTSLLQPSTLPSALGILAFVYAGHSTFPVIQRSMARPSEGPRAVAIGYVCTALICSVIGAFGYALYKASTAAVITANLPAGSLALACTALTACNPFSAFALTLETVAVALQRKLVAGQQSVAAAGSSSSRSNDAENNAAAAVPPYPLRAAVRLALALCCCQVACSLPYVADLMAFVGALLTMSISLIIPALMHVRLLWGQQGAWGLGLDAAVVLLGVLCAVVGAASALNTLQLKMAAAAGAC